MLCILWVHQMPGVGPYGSARCSNRGGCCVQQADSLPSRVHRRTSQAHARRPGCAAHLAPQQTARSASLKWRYAPQPHLPHISARCSRAIRSVLFTSHKVETCRLHDAAGRPSLDSSRTCCGTLCCCMWLSTSSFAAGSAQGVWQWGGHERASSGRQPATGFSGGCRQKEEKAQGELFELGPGCCDDGD